MGVILLVVTVIVFLVFERLFGIERFANLGSGQRGVAQAPPLRRTPMTIGLAAYSFLVTLFLLGPPVAVVIMSFASPASYTFPPSGWSLSWYRAMVHESVWRDSAWLSLRVALLAATMATSAGLLAALALARHRFRGSSVFKALSLAPLIVPVILYAAAIFDFESRLNLTASVVGYAVAHAVLALPFTVIILRAALGSVDADLDAAAVSLGASRTRAFRAITFRLVLPAIAAAALIGFITSWDEPVVSLFLSGLAKTLPVYMFTFIQQQLDPTIAAVSSFLLLIAIAVVAVAAAAPHLIRVRRH
jgi:ABC-type spermidine/putrescine transport system permease subunit II